MFQLFKSERWNSAVFEVVLCVAVGELYAELVDLPGLRCCVPGCCVHRRVCFDMCLLWHMPGLASRVPCLGAPPGLVRGERRDYSACPASRAASWAAFLARAWASTSSGVSGPCVVPALPSVRRHEMVRASRTPNRAR